ncbi:hypothetical protein Tco_0604554 [Tanacetum coccineum]
MRTKIELTLEQTQQGVSNEVLSDTKVFTMTMEIIPEPTSNKLCGSPPKTTPQTEGEQVRDKGKKALAHEEMVEEESESNFDAEIRLSGIKHVVKADAAKSELKKGKHDLIDLLGLDVVERCTGITGLHLGEWKEVMDACPKRTRAGWTTIYSQIRQRLDAFNKLKQS